MTQVVSLADEPSYQNLELHPTHVIVELEYTFFFLIDQRTHNLHVALERESNSLIMVATLVHNVIILMNLVFPTTRIQHGLKRI